MNDGSRDYVSINGFNQIWMLTSPNQIDSLAPDTKNMFEKQLVNKEKKRCPYLVYTERIGRLFCAPC